MPGYRIISSDNHIFEPADLWTTGMEPVFRDQAPQVIHVESTFPRSQEILEEILADCSETEKAKIAGGNATCVYNF